MGSNRQGNNLYQKNIFEKERMAESCILDVYLVSLFFQVYFTALPPLQKKDKGNCGIIVTFSLF